MSLEVKTKTTGFGSPAETYVDKRLDLNDLIPMDTMTTYYFKYAGEEKLGIKTGDILVVDKSVEPELGDLVLIKEKKIQRDGQILILINVWLSAPFDELPKGRLFLHG